MALQEMHFPQPLISERDERSYTKTNTKKQQRMVLGVCIVTKQAKTPVLLYMVRTFCRSTQRQCIW